MKPVNLISKEHLRCTLGASFIFFVFGIFALSILPEWPGVLRAATCNITFFFNPIPPVNNFTTTPPILASKTQKVASEQPSNLIILTCVTGSEEDRSEKLRSLYEVWKTSVSLVKGARRVVNVCEGKTWDNYLVKFDYMNEWLQKEASDPEVNMNSIVFFTDLDVWLNVKHTDQIIERYNMLRSFHQVSDPIIVQSDWRCWVGQDCSKTLKKWLNIEKTGGPRYCSKQWANSGLWIGTLRAAIRFISDSLTLAHHFGARREYFAEMLDSWKGIFSDDQAMLIFLHSGRMSNMTNTKIILDVSHDMFATICTDDWEKKSYLFSDGLLRRVNTKEKINDPFGCEINSFPVALHAWARCKPVLRWIRDEAIKVQPSPERMWNTTKKTPLKLFSRLHP